MHRLLSPTLLLLGVLTLASCETMEPAGSGRRPAPRVLIPGGLGASERQLLPEVEDALADAGFRPTYHTPAEYILAFEVDDGPVNADVHLRLLQHGEEVAHAYARTGGPGILLHRREYIRKSFEKCLDQFEGQIHGLVRRGWRNRGYDDGYQDRYEDGNDRYGYDRSPYHQDRGSEYGRSY